jgi:iron complex outermembrane receptor protein
MSTNLRSILFVSASAAALLTMTPAYAQPAGDSSDIETVVVTGTSLHGVAPAGAETLSVTAADIAASGATSVQGLLADIPQMGSFGGTPYSGIGGTQLTVNRVNLRGLPQGVGGGSPTLVLIDGHRFVGDGVNQTVPDPGILPNGMIDRVEVVLDGGSAVYGADAIGGVINFVTKKNIDGFEVDGSHGFGDSYNTTNINALAGKSWGNGSVYIGYSYAYNSAIDNADRGYEKQLNYSTGVGLPFGVQCNPGNVVSGGMNYAISSPTSLTPGRGNICDGSKYGQMFPQETRNSLMAGLDQDITSNLHFEVKAFYSERTDVLSGGPAGFTVLETSASPYYISTGGGSTASQQVSGLFVSAGERPQHTRLKTWGITPSLVWDIGGDWVMTAFYNAGWSRTTVDAPGVDATGLQASTAGGNFNPYDPGASSNAAAMAEALNYDNYGMGQSVLNNAKVVFDGPVFSLPGGDVRAAAGSEFIGESYHGGAGGAQGLFGTFQDVHNTSLNPISSYRRHEVSGFGELHIPVLGNGFELPFLQSLDLSAAMRYDNYSDFGHVWTPSYGFTAKPVDWITLRGKYNKAFQAPSPAQLAAATPLANAYPVSIVQSVQDLINPAYPNPTAGLINISGTDPHLQPQHAQTKDLGLDISPPFIPGLTLHTTYFDIEYGGEISTPHLGYSTNYFSAFQNDYVMFPSIADASAYMAAHGVKPANAAQVLTQITNNQGTSPYPIYFIADTLYQNLGASTVSGFDLGFDYKYPVSFGSLFANMNGTYLESFKNIYPGTPAPNGVGTQASGGPVARFNFTAAVGVSVGDDFMGQIKWNHLDGFSLFPSPPAGYGQTSVRAYDTFDLHAEYNLQRESLPPITLSLTVTNILDTDPPHYFGVGGAESGNPSYGYADSNLGRVVQLGAAVKF